MTVMMFVALAVTASVEVTVAVVVSGPRVPAWTTTGTVIPARTVPAGIGVVSAQVHDTVVAVLAVQSHEVPEGAPVVVTPLGSGAVSVRLDGAASGPPVGLTPGVMV
jgi:hypothetical protein